MVRKLAVLVVLSLAGLVMGVEAAWFGMQYQPSWFGWLGGYRYSYAQQIVLPTGSDAPHLVAMVRGQDPGVQVVSRSRFIAISATGGIHANWRVKKASREILVASKGSKARWIVGDPVAGPGGNPMEYGLLAGLGAGLGFFVPPKRRVHP